MKLRRAPFSAAQFGGAACLALLASCRSVEADTEAAVAGAIKTSLEEWVGADVIGGAEASQGLITICLEHKDPLDVAAVAENLSGTIIRPIPVVDCSSETIEGNFGMFAAVTNYFAPDGTEAGHLEIAKVDCPTPTMCVVEIDSLGSGDSYRMERRAGHWKTTKQWNRWVV